MSRRDRAHLLTALWDLTRAQPGVAVDIADVAERIGRSRGDMRTVLNLESLADDGLVAAIGGGWALTPQGVARIAEDRELSSG